MKIVESIEKRNLVRADSREAKNGFRKWHKTDEEWDYFVPMCDNSMNLSIRRTKRKGRNIFIEPEYILIFNVRDNSAGLVKSNAMVEPIDFTVIEKERT